jgi:hypothetical protein
MKLKRYDIKKILADPAKRREMIIRGTIAIQAREGIDITYEEAARSYDFVMKEKAEKEKKALSDNMTIRERAARNFGV